MSDQTPTDPIWGLPVITDEALSQVLYSTLKLIQAVHRDLLHQQVIQQREDLAVTARDVADYLEYIRKELYYQKHPPTDDQKHPTAEPGQV